jgi:hypothetical protein
MVCPICIATAIGQAALPVATAVGGAVAAKTFMKAKRPPLRGVSVEMKPDEWPKKPTNCALRSVEEVQERKN